MKLHSKIILVIKIIVSPLLIVWLIKNEYFSLANIKLGLSNWLILSMFLVASFFQLLISCFRTIYLLQNDKISTENISKILRISWASTFMNCISPNAIFGELFKAKELVKLVNSSADNSIYSSIFAKIFSLLGLITISLIASFSFKDFNPDIKKINLFCSIVFTLFFITLFSGEFLKNYIEKFFIHLNGISKNNFYNRRLEHLKIYILKLLLNHKTSLRIYLLSLAIQVLNTISFILIIYSLNPFLAKNISLVITLTPIGFFIMTLPISFSGLGVGHVAFSALLKLAGIKNGADIFTIYFLFSFFFNLIGIIPFIGLWKKRSSIKLKSQEVHQI